MRNLIYLVDQRKINAKLQMYQKFDGIDLAVRGRQHRSGGTILHIKQYSICYHRNIQLSACLLDDVLTEALHVGSSKQSRLQSVSEMIMADESNTDVCSRASVKLLDC